MRKKINARVFFSLGGNGSFLTIKDAIACLQHHVGYSLVCTRNFCQLIFPARVQGVVPHVPVPGSPFHCPGRCAGSIWLSRVPRACSRALGYPGHVPKSPCPPAASLPTWSDLRRGAVLLCACSHPSCRSSVPWETRVFPGFSGDINCSSRSSNSSCTDSKWERRAEAAAVRRS